MDTDILQKSCFFTGHRILSQSKTEELKHILRWICVSLIENQGVEHFINGGALGFDMLCAAIVLELKKTYPQIRLHMYLPCRDQAARWNEQSRSIYRYILEKADEVLYVTDGKYITGCMQLRNKTMVNHALYGIAYCNNTHSGTYSTITYAEGKSRFLYLLRNGVCGLEMKKPLIP